MEAPAISTLGTSVEGTPATSEDVISFINKDGTFKEGWKDVLLPEELRKENFYDSDFAKDIPTILKTVGNQAKMMGKKGVVPISEKSSEMEIAEFRKAMGVPDQYNYAKPEDIKSVDLSDEFVKPIFEKFNKAHLNQGQFDVVMGVVHDYFRNLEKEYEDSVKEDVRKAEETIMAEHGVNYDSDVHLANFGIEKITAEWPPERKQRIFGTPEAPAGINAPEFAAMRPFFLDFCTEVGKRVSEGKIVTEVEGTVTGSLQDQIDTLMKTDEYKNAANPKHQKTVELVQKLFAEKAKRENR